MNPFYQLLIVLGFLILGCSLLSVWAIYMHLHKERELPLELLEHIEKIKRENKIRMLTYSISNILFDDWTDIVADGFEYYHVHISSDHVTFYFKKPLGEQNVYPIRSLIH